MVLGVAFGLGCGTANIIVHWKTSTVPLAFAVDIAIVWLLLQVVAVVVGAARCCCCCCKLLLLLLLLLSNKHFIDFSPFSSTPWGLPSFWSETVANSSRVWGELGQLLLLPAWGWWSRGGAYCPTSGQTSRARTFIANFLYFSCARFLSFLSFLVFAFHSHTLTLGIWIICLLTKKK